MAASYLFDAGRKISVSKTIGKHARKKMMMMMMMMMIVKIEMHMIIKR